MFCVSKAMLLLNIFDQRLDTLQRCYSLPHVEVKYSILRKIWSEMESILTGALLRPVLNCNKLQFFCTLVISRSALLHGAKA